MSLGAACPWLALAVVAGVVVVQSLIVRRYVGLLASARPGRATGVRPLPRAAVVLSVRGADPRLAAVLEGLLDQEYPDYRVSIVVDSRDDPAWPIVAAAAAQARPGMVAVDVLHARLETCSLKCAALAQAVEALPADVAAVAFVDGDTVPHRSWLGDLVTALDEPGVGAATGNRWYVPREPTFGAIVRHSWNAGAVVQVWFNGIPWAGSLAVRRETLLATGIVDSWRRSLSVDGTVGRRLKARRLAVRFVPEALMANDEHIARGAFAEWLVRQLVAARSTRGGWGVVLMHAGIMLVCQVLPLVALFVAASRRDVAGAAIACAALVTYWAGCVGAASAIDRAARGVARRQGQELPAAAPLGAWRRLAATIDAHLVYFVALARASFCRKVRWRGIEYEISDCESVRMVSYATFGAGGGDSGASIT